MKHTLTLLAALLLIASLPVFAEPPDIRISPIHIHSKTGGVGDAIAFYWQGQYHVFYLYERKWAHVVSTDLIHWKDLPPALLPCDDPAGPDFSCWTGSVVEHAGTFYLFYTGQNPKDPKNDQKVMLATSKDLITWEKQPDRTFYPDGKIYWSKSINGPIPGMGYHHQAFRDPDVFWHEGEKQWWMIFHALTAEGHKPCIALYTSSDLLNWTPRAPLATYTQALSLDCPHAAPIQGRWFILAADTSYTSADKPEGPYPPDMKLYDSGDLFVPKSLFDGKRRLIWGWIRDVEGSCDSGKPLWGGTLSLPREIFSGPAGQLYSRPAAEITAAFTRTALNLASAPQPDITTGTWKYQDGKLFSGPEGGACRFNVPDDYMMQGTFQLDPAATLTVKMRQQTDGNAGYPLVISPKKQEVSISRAQNRFGRKIELDATQPITVQAFVQGAILECFINGKEAFTCRAYDYSKGGLSLEVAGGQMTILDLTVKTLPAPVTSSVVAQGLLRDKTLVVWASPANLTQHGGSVLTIDDRAKHFDGIVFGEIAPAKWMAGSERWSRTEQQQDGWPAETADANTLVQIAVAYKGNEITVYRNGEEYSRHTVRDSVPLKPESLVIIGQRYFGAEDFFKGAVEDARIYDRALSAEQIEALKPKVHSELKPWAWFTFEDAAATERTGRFPHVRLSAGAKVEQGRLQLNGKNGALCAANSVELANAASNAASNAANANRADAVRFWPENRKVGDVMPFYWKGEYHLFYLLNASGNYDINWEHAVSKDLVHWRNLPAAIVRDPADKTGPEGGCMFTGSIIEDHGTFHAFYTSYNPKNPAGREFICHATSKDLMSWTKHPEEMIEPDGIHYHNKQLRDFRDPCVVWDEEQKQYVMTINANRPGKGGFVYGRLTSRDLKRWEQLPALENIPGDECPDFFKAGETYYMHGCNVYAFAKNKNGPWQFPSYNKVDRRMAAKRVFDGKRHVWFGGWLGGPMSIPREVYEGPDGLLLMKPVPEIVNVFSEVALSVSDLSLAAGSTLTKAVPLDYMLTATVDLSKGQELGLTVRGDGNAKASRIVLSADKKTLQTTGRQGWESRPLPIDFGRPVTLQAFILGGVAEVFVNSQFAATFFIDAAGGTLGLESRGSVVVQSLQVRTAITRNPEKP